MQLERVIVAVDFSATSLAAARWVAMQLAPRAEVVLAHVVTEPAAPAFLRPHLPPLSRIVADLTPGLEGALRGLAGAVDSARVRVRLLTGEPVEALASFGQELGADLICLGRRRSRRGAARFGHTTAQRLLAQTRIPVLVVPSARPTHPARILAPIDDRPGSSTDLAAACELAQAYDAAIEVLHVLSPELPRVVSSGAAVHPPSLLARLHGTGKEQLELLTQDWLASQVRKVSGAAPRLAQHVRFGDPGEQIIDFVRAAGVDLVVIGRGHNETAANATSCAAEELPLGSTARLVLLASPCPVLVLSPTPHAARPTIPLAGRRRLQMHSDAPNPAA